jgi:hypothetical protein
VETGRLAGFCLPLRPGPSNSSARHTIPSDVGLQNVTPLCKDAAASNSYNFEISLLDRVKHFATLILFGVGMVSVKDLESHSAPIAS